MRVVIWVGTCEGTQFIFVGGKVLEGMGPMQRELKPIEYTTLGKLRQEWGDDEVGEGVPLNTVCEVYEGQYSDGLVVGIL
jgi:hypothetical protein